MTAVSQSVHVCACLEMEIYAKALIIFTTIHSKLSFIHILKKILIFIYAIKSIVARIIAPQKEFAIQDSNESENYLRMNIMNFTIIISI